MLALLRHALAMLRNVKLLALHLVVNAVLLISASFWLLIPEAHIWQLLFAFVSALLIVGIFLWLHSGTLAYAVDPTQGNFHGSFAIKIWRLFGLFLAYLSPPLVYEHRRRMDGIKMADGWISLFKISHLASFDLGQSKLCGSTRVSSFNSLLVRGSVYDLGDHCRPYLWRKFSSRIADAQALAVSVGNGSNHATRSLGN